MKFRGEKIQVIIKFKLSLTKAGKGVLTSDILYSTVEEGSLLILHLADQLGCGKICFGTFLDSNSTTLQGLVAAILGLLVAVVELGKQT